MAEEINPTERQLAEATEQAIEKLGEILDVEAGLREVLQSAAPSDPGSGS